MHTHTHTRVCTCCVLLSPLEGPKSATSSKLHADLVPNFPVRSIFERSRSRFTRLYSLLSGTVENRWHGWDSRLRIHSRREYHARREVCRSARSMVSASTRSRLDSCVEQNGESRARNRDCDRDGWQTPRKRREREREIQLHLVEVHGDIGSPCTYHTHTGGCVPCVCARASVHRCACVPQRRRVVDPTAHSALYVFQTTQNTTCLGNALQAVSNLIWR